MKTHYLYLTKIVAFNEEQMPVHFHRMRKLKADCPQPWRTLVLSFQPWCWCMRGWAYQGQLTILASGIQTARRPSLPCSYLWEWKHLGMVSPPKGGLGLGSGGVGRHCVVGRGLVMVSAMYVLRGDKGYPQAETWKCSLESITVHFSLWNCFKTWAFMEQIFLQTDLQWKIFVSSKLSPEKKAKVKPFCIL